MVGRLVPGSFLFFELVLHMVKASGQHLSFDIFWYTWFGTYIKNRLYIISGWSGDVHNFDFSEKRSRTSFSITFCVWFFKKSLSHQILLSLLLEILGNMCIAIICCPFSDVINFLIKPFFYITKYSGKNCKYLKNKMSF